MLIHQPQEIPITDPACRYLFQPSTAKPLHATPAALDRFGIEVIYDSLRFLQDQAREGSGLDYLQVFEDEATGDRLWFIEDDAGGAITALLPSDY